MKKIAIVGSVARTIPAPCQVAERFVTSNPLAPVRAAVALAATLSPLALFARKDFRLRFAADRNHARQMLENANWKRTAAFAFYAALLAVALLVAAGTIGGIASTTSRVAAQAYARTVALAAIRTAANDARATEGLTLIRHGAAPNAVYT